MSEVKVNKITPTAACGTVTLGDSGDTFTIPSGATLTNSGSINNSGTITNTGTISGGTITGVPGTTNWDTTPKTSDFNAVSGNGYFVNTTAGAVTVTLPSSPSAGDYISIKDYANTADTNNITIDRNGSNIQGTANNFTISIEGLAITLLYSGATEGWISTGAAQASDIAEQGTFITATGGTILTSGDYKTHVFTGPGTFCVSSIANPAGGPNIVDYLVVAGGAGGNGAGGFRVSNCATRSCLPAPSMSPLVTSTGITITATAYPIIIGSGGVGPGPAPTIGNPSSFSTITSAGGGLSVNGTPSPSISGGSGGGGGAYVSWSPQVQSAGSGNTPPVSPSQGNPGANVPGLVNPSGSSITFGGGGGGGAAASGFNGGIGSFVSDNFFGPTSPSYGTPGPVGSTRYFTGGGSGFSQDNASPLGSGSGGAGGGGGPSCVNGGTNTGGAGGLVFGLEAGSGGSGIIVIRYKYQ